MNRRMQVHIHSAFWYARRARAASRRKAPKHKKSGRGLLVAAAPLNLLQMDRTNIINRKVSTASRHVLLVIQATARIIPATQIALSGHVSRKFLPSMQCTYMHLLANLSPGSLHQSALTRALNPRLTLSLTSQDSAWTPVLSGPASWMSKVASESTAPIGSTAVCCAAPTRGSSCGFSGAEGVAEFSSTLGWYYQRQSAALGAVSVSLVAGEVSPRMIHYLGPTVHPRFAPST